MSKLRTNELESLETGRSLKVDEMAQTFDYEAGIKITSYSQMVRDESGEFWRVSGQIELPYVTTGAGIPEGNALVSAGDAGDAELRQDLANGKSALVDSAVVGWRGRTVADRLDDTTNVKDYGAVADGSVHPLSERFSTLAAAQAVYPHATSLTQSIDWAAAQAAFNSDAVRVHFPGTGYVISDDLTRSADTILCGDGSTKLVMAEGKSILIAGSHTVLPYLGANITKTSRTVAFASAPDLQSGDVFIVHNPTDYSWSPHRASYREGEFFQVHSVAGSVVSIYGRPADNYTAGEMNVYRVNGVRVSVEDIEIVADGDGNVTPLVVRFGVGVTLKNARGSGRAGYQIELDRCYQVDVSGGGMVNSLPGTDDSYGLLISNCHRVTIVGGGHAASRHAIALGGGGGVCAVPCRDIHISSLTLINTSPDIGAADMHGNCDRVTYDNCVINSHANMAGRDVAYTNCTIYGGTAPSVGGVIYGSEIVGGTYRITDCVFITAGTLDSFGAIYLLPRSLLKQDWTLEVRGLSIKGGAGGALAKIVQAGVHAGETKKCNMDIRGVRCELAQALAVLYVRCEDNVAQTVVSDGHIVDDIYGPAGMHLIYPTGAALTGIKTREMEQMGEVAATTVAGEYAIPAPVSFRYLYSKRPTATTGVSAAGGANITTIGGRVPVPVIYNLGASSIRPAIVAASGAFTAGDSALLHWRAGIKEI